MVHDELSPGEDKLRRFLDNRAAFAWRYDIRPKLDITKTIIPIHTVSLGKIGLKNFLEQRFGHREIWATYERSDGQLSSNKPAKKYRSVRLSYSPRRSMIQTILEEMKEGEIIGQLVEVRDGLAACGHIVYQPIVFTPKHFMSLSRSLSYTS